MITGWTSKRNGEEIWEGGGKGKRVRGTEEQGGTESYERERRDEKI